MRAYSADLRERVLAACEDGATTGEAAEAFAVSASWVRSLRRRFRETGEAGPRVRARCGPAPALAGHRDRLAALVASRPGLTAGEYRDLLGARVAVVTVWRALRRLGLTHKKSPPRGGAGPAGGRSRPGGVAG